MSSDPTTAVESVVEVAAVSDVAVFRKNLLSGAREARKNGTIDRSGHLLVIATCARPAKLAEWMQTAHGMAVEEGFVTVQAVDWDKVFSFLEKLIPLLITLFGPKL